MNKVDIRTICIYMTYIASTFTYKRYLIRLLVAWVHFEIVQICPKNLLDFNQKCSMPDLNQMKVIWTEPIILTSKISSR